MTRRTVADVPATPLFQEWRHRVAGNVHGVTPEAIDAMARYCADRAAAGIQPNNVWHAFAQHYGFEHRCNCAPCERERAEWLRGEG